MLQWFYYVTKQTFLSHSVLIWMNQNQGHMGSIVGHCRMLVSFNRLPNAVFGWSPVLIYPILHKEHSWNLNQWTSSVEIVVWQTLSVSLTSWQYVSKITMFVLKADNLPVIEWITVMLGNEMLHNKMNVNNHIWLLPTAMHLTLFAGGGRRWKRQWWLVLLCQATPGLHCKCSDNKQSVHEY